VPPHSTDRCAAAARRKDAHRAQRGADVGTSRPRPRRVSVAIFFHMRPATSRSRVELPICSPASTREQTCHRALRSKLAHVVQAQHLAFRLGGHGLTRCRAGLFMNARGSLAETVSGERREDWRCPVTHTGASMRRLLPVPIAGSLEPVLSATAIHSMRCGLCVAVCALRSVRCGFCRAGFAGCVLDLQYGGLHCGRVESVCVEMLGGNRVSARGCGSVQLALD
jgi:hypothetical protein